MLCNLVITQAPHGMGHIERIRDGCRRNNDNRKLLPSMSSKYFLDDQKYEKLGVTSYQPLIHPNTKTQANESRPGCLFEDTNILNQHKNQKL